MSFVRVNGFIQGNKGKRIDIPKAGVMKKRRVELHHENDNICLHIIKEDKNEKLDEIVLEKLGYTDIPEPDLGEWNIFLQRFKFPKKEITIGLIGKYKHVASVHILGGISRKGPLG